MNLAPDGYHAELQHDWVRPSETPAVDPSEIVHYATREDDGVGVDIYWWKVVKDDGE